MSPKSSPWRNGSQESFFGRFKVEFGDPNRFKTEGELIEELYVKIAYFRDSRIKNKLKMSPAKFRLAWQRRQEMISAANLDRQKIAA